MARIGDSELIINSDGTIFHLHLRPEDLADNVILVGDPGRVDLVKSFFTSIENESSSREFRSATGIYNDTRFTVLSTGIGCDNLDIVMTELDALSNIDFETREVKSEHRRLTILRIGSSGAIQPEIPLGGYLFSEISVGFDGLINWYGGRENIVLEDFEESFLKQVTWNKYLPIPYFVKASERLTELFRGSTIPGMTIAAGGFYGPQCRVVRLPLVNPDLMEELEKFEFKGRKITNFEMEGSALAAMAAHLGHDGATICLIIAHRYAKQANPDYKPLMNDLVKLALDKLSGKC